MRTVRGERAGPRRAGEPHGHRIVTADIEVDLVGVDEDQFNQLLFEHIHLADGCEMVDGSGEIVLDSNQCVGGRLLRRSRPGLLHRRGPGRRHGVRRPRRPRLDDRASSRARRHSAVLGNELLFGLQFLAERRDNWTVALGLSRLAGSIEVPTTVPMAGAVILTLPIIVIFYAGERLLTGGLAPGTQKG